LTADYTLLVYCGLALPPVDFAGAACPPPMGALRGELGAAAGALVAGPREGALIAAGEPMLAPCVQRGPGTESGRDGRDGGARASPRRMPGTSAPVQRPLDMSRSGRGPGAGATRGATAVGVLTTLVPPTIPVFTPVFPAGIPSAKAPPRKRPLGSSGSLPRPRKPSAAGRRGPLFTMIVGPPGVAGGCGALYAGGGLTITGPAVQLRPGAQHQP